MRIVIVEDEPVAARRLERLVREIPAAASAQFTHCQSLDDLLGIGTMSTGDILLLDLNLSGDNGFTALDMIAGGGFSTIVVSGNVERAIEAFAYGVVDFVPKPVEPERLLQAFGRIPIPSPAQQANKSLAVKDGGRLRFVRLDDIAFVKGGGDYAEVHLRDKSFFLDDRTLDAMEKELPESWLRVHKSYIVDSSRIESLLSHGGGRHACILNDGTEIPVGRSRYAELGEKLAGR